MKGASSLELCCVSLKRTSCTRDGLTTTPPQKNCLPSMNGRAILAIRSSRAKSSSYAKVGFSLARSGFSITLAWQNTVSLYLHEKTSAQYSSRKLLASRRCPAQGKYVAGAASQEGFRSVRRLFPRSEHVVKRRGVAGRHVQVNSLILSEWLPPAPGCERPCPGRGRVSL